MLVAGFPAVIGILSRPPTAEAGNARATISRAPGARLSGGALVSALSRATDGRRGRRGGVEGGDGGSARVSLEDADDVERVAGALVGDEEPEGCSEDGRALGGAGDDALGEGMTFDGERLESVGSTKLEL